jgi:hypothetical protein
MTHNKYTTVSVCILQNKINESENEIERFQKDKLMEDKYKKPVIKSIQKHINRLQKDILILENYYSKSFVDDELEKEIIEILNIK